MISKVLVPIDFSEYSKNAFKYSVDFVKLFDAELFLIYVVEPIIYPADFSLGQVAIPSIDIDMQKKAEDELNSLAKQFIKNNLKYKVVIKTGKPFVEINEYAREQDIDMIIMATHGHTGVEHLLFGSTAEKVVRKAPCPVLTLREPIKGFSYKN
ncbi:MAG: universal stress protein [Ignavibacteriaceae bacterium]|jgi:nucleotide-binding universal stress UspA family protein|nr:universal stress protein [Ignavibacteriaceae bacterium]